VQVSKLRIAPAIAAWPLLVLAVTALAPTAAHAQSATPAPTTGGGAIFVRGYGGTTFKSTDTGSPPEHPVVVGGGVGLNLGSHFAVIGDAGYISTVATQEGAAALKHVVSLITLVSGNADVTLKAQTLYVLGGARFALRSRSARWNPFVEGQGGIMRSTFKLEITGSDPTVVTDATARFKSVIGGTSSTAPAVAAGGGIDIRLASRIAAEAGYHYLRLFGNAKTNTHEVFGGIKFNF
jgi:opacity protein-like surface antigen